jgi:hypothetical protein
VRAFFISGAKQAARLQQNREWARRVRIKGRSRVRQCNNSVAIWRAVFQRERAMNMKL